jgi:membrane-associated phospholipid phosphatase
LTVKKANAKIVKAAQTYARVGLAVADAFICCWKTKFIFFNERPATYVKSNIDPNWSSFWPEPPFPAFPSGHSTQSAATATVLAGMYGDNFSFVDNTHEGARRFPFFQPMKPRSYSTFWQTAEESAYSRYLGGIHTAQDNTVGLAEGKKIGTNVNALAWTR